MSWVSQSINLIKEEEARFTSFSVFFKPERIQEVAALFVEANNIPSDKVYVDIQAQATENINTCVEACAKFYQACKFDIETVFPNKKHIWNQFGFNDYEAARKSGRAMFMFYSDFILIANLHKEAMTAAAWTEATFTKIAELKDKLKINMDQQTKCRVDRGRATDERVVCLNNIYEKLSKYMKAAKIIYANNEEMLRWFKFPVSSKGSKEESTEFETQEDMA
ncbi:hypothetical protein DWB61_11350 [Ancylomarina euxinus]|uniref:Uncharacterized protein n=2 Tax=Ancylomarina euxinus TaxID=2283627 RepID=A0A425Y010_9BACT|nr:hypothetical protein DWB61_11350 [Ancylomarina euxinus]